MGFRIAKSDTQAFEWIRRSAINGYVYAQNNLGVMYSNGRGVPKDEVIAVNWYRKSADQGNAQAQNNLGAAYSNGRRHVP